MSFRALSTQFDAATPCLLRTFACDCAERLFWRERMQACEPFGICWEMLATMRESLVSTPEASAPSTLRQKALEEYATRDEPRTSYLMLTQQRSNHRACLRAAWALVSPEPKHAALTAAQALSTMGPDDELRWSLARFSWLSSTHQWAGDRMPLLLAQGDIEIPEAVRVVRSS